MTPIVHIIRARWVAPIDQPLIEDGAVLLGTRRAGPYQLIAADAARVYPPQDVIVRDFGDAVILPGLVNAHTHLELSHLRPPTDVASFSEWLSKVMSAPSQSPGESVLAGAVECLRYGVMVVGDISRDPAAARHALRATRLRGVSYGEVVGMSGRRHLLEPRLAAASDPESQTRDMRIGVSPHAPYSIDADGYRRCLDEALRRQLPFTTHLAESPDESQFLADHTGPFARLWDQLGGLDSTVGRFAGGPIRYAKSLGLLDYPLTLLAHVNYCDDDELDILAAGRASVVYCPRTHAYFGHPPHRWREMLARRINVCVGTDSRASAPDLNLVEDLRLLHRIAPEVPAQTLWEMGTVRGARALGLAPWSQVWVVFPAKTSDPLLELLETEVAPLWSRPGVPPL